jgi:hypothetical protein
MPESKKGKKGAPVAGAAARFEGGGSGEERGRSGVKDAVLQRFLLLLRTPLLLLLQQEQNILASAIDSHIDHT